MTQENPPQPVSRLDEYRRKRSFARTPEPRGEDANPGTGRAFVVQKHAARNLHYDLRLEMDGILKSWAVPRGPCLDPRQKPLAVLVEDHPIEYGSFEGIIPQGEYGGGTVMLWDRGEWEPIGDAVHGLAKGDLKFILHGRKLRGEWVLARMTGKDNESGRNWLLIKKRDAEARSLDTYNILGEEPYSILTGRTMEQIATEPQHVWKDDHAQTIPQHADVRLAAPISPRIALNVASLPEAVSSPLPPQLRPQLCTSSRQAPDGQQWLHEVKLDGYRVIARLDAGKVQLFTRNGHDWTDRMPRIARELESLSLESGFLDGEVVVLDDRGLSDFAELQRAFQHRLTANMRYFVFDLPFAEGHDLARVPLLRRKELLQELFETAGTSDTIQYCQHILGHGPVVFDQAAAGGAEGIISKRTDSRYEQRRSHAWLKIKAVRRQEFVVVGFTDPSGSRSGFGALVLGAHANDGELHYCGRVGTGFSDHLLEQFAQQLTAYRIEAASLTDPQRDPDHASIHWVRPELVVEVEFTGWTRDGLLRHPAFVALREDKSPREVMLDTANQPGTDATPTARRSPANVVVVAERSPEDALVGGVRISHPSRTVYPEQRITKQQVAQYYVAVSDWMLPHIVSRPLSIVRCPLGLAGESFYQRERKEGFPDAVRGLAIGEDSAIVIDDLDGLLSLVQMGVLEIHCWGCREDKPDRPDRLVLDLDPGAAITWEHLVATGHFIRTYLEDLGLASFVKTSGGKGLHIVIPIQRRTTWMQAKMFTLAIAKDLVRIAPQNFVATMTKDLRAGRIFIDYLRNQLGSTSVAVLSTRARPGALVSMPLSWDDLRADLPPSEFNIRSAPHRLRETSGATDPWQGFSQVRQSITKQMLARFDLR